MEIVKNKIFTIKEYNEIKTGDVFTYNGTVFLKMDIDGSVDLSDGMTKEEFENRCCDCHKINCNDCDHPTEKEGVK